MSTLVTLEKFVGAPMHVHAGGAVQFHESGFSSGQVIPGHAHAEAVISLVLAGEGVDDGDKGTRRVGSQDVLFTPAYVPHGYHFAKSGRWFNIQLADEWLARATDGERHLPRDAAILKGHTAAIWAARVRSEAQLRDSVSSMAIDGALILMLAELARTRDPGAATRPRWLRASKKRSTLDAGFSDQAHFTRVFRHTYGETPGEYARSTRRP